MASTASRESTHEGFGYEAAPQYDAGQCQEGDVHDDRQTLPAAQMGYRRAQHEKDQPERRQRYEWS